MPFRTRTLVTLPWILAAALAIHSAPSRAQLVEGTDYRKLEAPLPTDSPGKIEVIEFFSYGCPHCNEFYPAISAWVAKLPHDVVFKRVPIGFNRPEWVGLQRAYYALQATGQLRSLDGPLFHALHEERLKLYEPDALANWVGSHGGNAGKFRQAYTSFSVNNQTAQADELQQKYGIDSIPSLAINGTYVAMADASHGGPTYFVGLLAHTDQLIARVRSENRSASAAKPPAAARKSHKSR